MNENKVRPPRFYKWRKGRLINATCWNALVEEVRLHRKLLKKLIRISNKQHPSKIQRRAKP